ncbi:MAG: ParA family protein [Proteobacteria bacterium]|nr:ParA family protein [Pseudomonadota bacterium]
MAPASKSKRSGAVAKPTGRKPKTAVRSLRLKPAEAPKTSRIIAICNQKGGCGKTTSVINIAATLAAMNQRVLVIDLDSQCNATQGLGIELNEIEETICDVLLDPKAHSLADVIVESPYANLHIAPGSIELSEYESRAANEIGRENRLKKAILQIREHYDFVLIDTPPSLGLLSVNALNAASEVQIAMQSHPFALDGLHLLLETIELVQEELNPELKISGVIVTMFDPRTKISREIVDEVCQIATLKGRVHKTVIRQNVKLTEASRLRKPVMYYDDQCSGTEDYVQISREIAAQSKAAPAHTKAQPPASKIKKQTSKNART